MCAETPASQAAPLSHQTWGGPPYSPGGPQSPRDPSMFMAKDTAQAQPLRKSAWPSLGLGVLRCPAQPGPRTGAGSWLHAGSCLAIGCTPGPPLPGPSGPGSVVAAWPPPRPLRPCGLLLVPLQKLRPRSAVLQGRGLCTVPGPAGALQRSGLPCRALPGLCLGLRAQARCARKRSPPHLWLELAVSSGVWSQLWPGVKGWSSPGSPPGRGSLSPIREYGDSREARPCPGCTQDTVEG